MQYSRQDLTMRNYSKLRYLFINNKFNDVLSA